MLRVLAKLRIYKLIRESCRYHHCYHSLLWCLKTISNLTNPVERIPFEKLETIDDHSFKFHYFNQILQKCTDASDLQTGMSIHTHLVKLNINGFFFIWNKLLGLCLKLGPIHYAHQLFDTMPFRDVSFNTMISVFVCNNCDALELVGLYSKMKKYVKPNHITFVGLIGACCHKMLQMSLPRGYIEPRKLLETSTLSHWWEECGRFREIPRDVHISTLWWKA